MVYPTMLDSINLLFLDRLESQLKQLWMYFLRCPEVVDILSGDDGDGELGAEDGFGGAEGEEVFFDVDEGVGADNLFVLVQDAHRLFEIGYN